jgi:MYXO-CTERM domain-containing protein
MLPSMAAAWTCRTRASSLVPLLLGVLTACGGERSEAPWQALARDFPTQSPRVVGGQVPLAATGAGWLAAAPASRWQRGIEVALPARGQDAIVLSDGDHAIRVFEEGAEGPGRLVEGSDNGALVYARRGGHAFWHATPSGAEEWLLLPHGVSDGSIPVASWRVEGGKLAQHGAAVQIDMGPGHAPLLVVADEAYGPAEQPLRVSLVADGDRLKLFVQASPGPVLVDPSWGGMATMNAGRAALTVTTLTSGQLLAVGGEANGTAFSSTQLFNPVAGTWSNGPNMFSPKSYHRATRLMNGDVLVTGGWNGNFPNDETFLYQAGANNFVFKSNMDFQRAAHSSTALLDGRVLVCGGAGGGGAESALQGPPIPQIYAVNDGPDVSNLVPFGGSGGFGGNDDCEVYDPAFNGGDWTVQTFMNDWRFSHAAARLNDGRVLISGGEDFGFVMTSAELFNPVTNSLSGTAPMLSARTGHTATTLADGRVLVTGGDNGGVSLGSTELYNPTLGTWSAGPAMGTARTQHSASVLTDGRVLVVGGFTGVTAQASAEIFDPVGNSWSVADPIPGARGDQADATMADGSVLVAGGSAGGTSNNTSYIFSLAGTLGSPCMQPSDCLSGFCTDQVCCDVACGSACEACTTSLKGSGNDGACGPIAAGTDPDLECAPAQCMGDDLNPADSCDGAGTCTDPGTVDCGSYTCLSATCLTTCTTSTECATNAYCDTGGMMCVPKKNDGEPANGGDECLSGFVADSVCCNTVCDLGVCDACSVAMGASADGTCTDVIGDCNDGNECTVSACDPAAGCQTSSKLDGSLCAEGVCVAGSCVPDAVDIVNPSGTTSSSASGGTGGAGGEGEPSFAGDPTLEGGGICSVAVPGSDQDDQTAWFALAVAAGVASMRRRRG